MKTLTPNEVAPVVVRRRSLVSFLRRVVSKGLLSVAFAIASMAAATGVASAQTSPTAAAQVFSTAGSGLSTQLLLVAGAIVLPAVAILAVKKGWPLLKRFF